MLQEELFEAEETEDFSLYRDSLSVSPNDFNVKTIVSCIDEEVFKIPAFQRNYVWDLKRASKLIESLLIGLPVPQIFLYEQDRDDFLVIDGQQRLMSIYYFLKGRFPRSESRSKLREIFDQYGHIPEDKLNDNTLFQDFRLKLEEVSGENNFNGKDYKDLEIINYQKRLNLSVIRNIVIKPEKNRKDENQALFEIFNRLNSGGVHLSNQEMRMSLYHSEFLRSLLEMNKDQRWRQILGKEEVDSRLNDVEVILRVLAFSSDFSSYKKSMLSFLNKFSNDAKVFDESKINFYRNLWNKFLSACENLDKNSFKFKSNKLSKIFFESVFYAVTRSSIVANEIHPMTISNEYIKKLKEDPRFLNSMEFRTSNINAIKERFEIAEEILTNF